MPTADACPNISRTSPSLELPWLEALAETGHLALPSSSIPFCLPQVPMPGRAFAALVVDPVLRGRGIEASANLDFPSRVLGSRHRTWANLCLRSRFARARHANLGAPSAPSSSIPFCVSQASKPRATSGAFCIDPVPHLRRFAPRASLCSIPFRVSAPARHRRRASRAEQKDGGCIYGSRAEQVVTSRKMPAASLAAS